MTASRRPFPNPQTANAQQCRRHKGLMRNIAASYFPSTRVTRRLNRSPGGSLSPAMLPSLLLATREKPGADKTGVEILGAHQCRCHKDLMRNTAASCFPSTRVALQPQLPPAGVSASPTRKETRGGQDGGRNFTLAIKLTRSFGLISRILAAVFA
jgi:hypothetical protein